MKYVLIISPPVLGLFELVLTDALPGTVKIFCKSIGLAVSELVVGLTRESLFEFLARSETRFLDPKFSRDSRETRESKLVVRLASRESHRQKFRSKTREK